MFLRRARTAFRIARRESEHRPRSREHANPAAGRRSSPSTPSRAERKRSIVADDEIRAPPSRPSIVRAPARDARRDVVIPSSVMSSGWNNFKKGWDEKVVPKMKEIGEKMAPPAKPKPPERPELLPLRELQKIPPPHPDGTPEARLLVVLQPPEELPPPPAPAGTYNFCVLVGNTLHVSGIGPLAPTAESHLGPAADVANGVRAARACALTMLSVLRKELGSLNHIKRLVKANGFVVVADPAPASVGGRHPEMMNGFRRVPYTGSHTTPIAW